MRDVRDDDDDERQFVCYNPFSVSWSIRRDWRIACRGLAPALRRRDAFQLPYNFSYDLFINALICQLLHFPSDCSLSTKVHESHLSFSDYIKKKVNPFFWQNDKIATKNNPLDFNANSHFLEIESFSITHMIFCSKIIDDTFQKTI